MKRGIALFLVLCFGIVLLDYWLELGFVDFLSNYFLVVLALSLIFGAIGVRWARL